MTTTAKITGNAGPSAVREFIAHVRNAGDGFIECGECWEPNSGWRVYMRSGNKALIVAPKIMRRIGKEMVARGSHDIGKLGRTMVEISAAAKEKQAKRIIPEGAAELLPARGTA